jgi:hypothetical protein
VERFLRDGDVAMVDIGAGVTTIGIDDDGVTPVLECEIQLTCDIEGARERFSSHEDVRQLALSRPEIPRVADSVRLLE